MSNQLVRYLSYAASGKIAANILLQLLGFEVPYLLALLLPLGLYLGIILAYGRLYADNEMSVMQAGGLSQARLVGITILFTTFIAAIILMLTVWINPLIAVSKERTLAAGMSAENVIASLMPGRFQVANEGKRVIYVENISRSRKVADNIFFADQVKQPNPGNAPSSWSVVSAARGYQAKDNVTNRSFLVAENGYRYEGVPGQNDYKITQFKKYSVQIPELTVGNKHQETEAIPTLALWDDYDKPGYAAELQWRLSIPLSAFLLSLLAVPLSHVRPRQGRYSSVLPAILIYVVYVNLLFVARNWVEQKFIPIDLGLWWVHILFLGIVLGVVFFQSVTFKQWFKRA
jgi:lipopolysaccharide export system permease protein